MQLLNSNLGSDHMITMTRIDEVADVEPDAGLHRWSLSKADWKLFKENSRLKIHQGIITDDAVATFQNFMEELRQTTSSAMPERKASGRYRKKQKPLLFWSQECTQAVYNRNRLRNKAARSKDLADQCKYIEENKNCQKIVTDTARHHCDVFCATLDSQSKLGPIWGMARRMNGGPLQKTMPTLVKAGIQAISSIDKANVLAETYATASSTDSYVEEFRPCL